MRSGVAVYGGFNFQRNIIYAYEPDREQLKGFCPTDAPDDSLASLAVRSLKARWRFLATGTPISNTLGETYVMMKYLMPEALKAAHEAAAVGPRDDAAAAEHLGVRDGAEQVIFRQAPIHG